MRVLPLHSDEVGEDPRGELGAHMWTEKLRRTARNLERSKSRAGPNVGNGSALHKEGEKHRAGVAQANERRTPEDY